MLDEGLQWPAVRPDIADCEVACGDLIQRQGAERAVLQVCKARASISSVAVMGNTLAMRRSWRSGEDVDEDPQPQQRVVDTGVGIRQVH